jgi:hypothetical protein
VIGQPAETTRLNAPKRPDFAYSCPVLPGKGLPRVDTVLAVKALKNALEQELTLTGGIAMTTGKSTAVCLGLVSAFALGVWVGPYVTGARDATSIAAVQPVPDAVASPVPQPSAAKTVAAAPQSVPAVPASSADLQKRLKPVLNEGMNLTIAAKGFRDGEQFAAVAHASRNLGVPFMVLKHRVLEERKSLATAIRELKPDVDAVKEANRARILARADVAAAAL